jgi:hypothetical protein
VIAILIRQNMFTRLVDLPGDNNAIVDQDFFFSEYRKSAQTRALDGGSHEPHAETDHSTSCSNGPLY